MDFDAICKYCGEKLPHEKCSEPTEFTEKGRAFIQQVLNNWGLISVRSWVTEACAEIDRLTTKREHLLEKVALQSKEIDRLTAELQAKDSDFIKHLKKVSKIVETWPVWEQNILGEAKSNEIS